MKRFPKFVLSILFAVSITLGTTIVAPVALAEPAQAVEAYNCSYVWKLSQQSYVYNLYLRCWYNYNWFEESWFGGGYRDGWVDRMVPVYA